jgi:hypothetical protein
MLGAFWEAVGGKLAERWASATGSALVFWLGGLLAWSVHAGGFPKLSMLTRSLNARDTTTQVAVILTLLLGVAASGLVVDRLTQPALRMLEGYWPRRLAPLRRRLVGRIAAQSAVDAEAWQQLAPTVFDDPAKATADELMEFARVDQRLRRRPSAANRLMPTRIGNILRASETRPYDKYGLDAVVAWSRLWLLLPDATRQELVAARGGLNSAVAAAVWGVMFCAFAAWTPFAVPVGLIVAACAVQWWVPSRAAIFGDLVEASYDVHCMALYDHLRWPLPGNPAEEHEEGQRLTTYLWRGSSDAEPLFLHSSKEREIDGASEG